MALPSDAEALLAEARSGNRGALARLLSKVEGPNAGEVVRTVHRLTGSAHVVGFTGAPGAGKSTLVDAIVAHLRGLDIEVGVLAVDPSSPFSGGAILGDRVRMSRHALDHGVFIRSMASRGSLGGLAGAAPNAVRVLDAVGRPVVLVETVGVGQVEIDIVETADTVVVVVNPGWGDAVQASKAGLLEIADIFAVNKADRSGADDAVRDLEGMLDLAPAGDWRPPVLKTVASTGEGVSELWNAIGEHRKYLGTDGRLLRRRREHLVDELRNLVVERIGAVVRHECGGPDFESLVDDVLHRQTDPHTAVETIIERAGFPIETEEYGFPIETEEHE